MLPYKSKLDYFFLEHLALQPLLLHLRGRRAATGAGFFNRSATRSRASKHFSRFMESSKLISLLSIYLCYYDTSAHSTNKYEYAQNFGF